VPEAQFTDIATIAESVKYSTGESIIRRGELGKSMYIVARGKVKITDGPRELGIWRARCFRPRTANVEALEDCTLLRLGGESLYELMSSNKEITRGIIQVLCGYTRNNLALATK